jgi:hypothetical protein
MVESFLQTEVAQVVGAEFVAQVAGELLILFEKSVLPLAHQICVQMTTPEALATEEGRRLTQISMKKEGVTRLVEGW